MTADRWGDPAATLAAGRDLVGYGGRPPAVAWPDGARVAVSLVLNVEEGAESSVLSGDPASETFLSEIIGAAPFADRHMSMESLYEYGSRAGFWRVLGVLDEFDVPATMFAVARALQLNPAAVEALAGSRHEVACHGLRWISYQEVDVETERAHLAEAVRVQTELLGAPPVGWYTGRDSPHTRALVVEHGGFAYDSDSYADDLPYWTRVDDTDHLVVPYTLDTNDMRFTTAQGFHTAEHFATYCRDAFDALWREGSDAPKMLSIGLHGRIIGRPARIDGLRRFLDHVLGHDDVWVCRRRDIAAHWAEHVPPPDVDAVAEEEDR
ncbi:MAG: allantoinase PuuE [Actinobacteria bacterium]|nr:allantoinase PuuE [Actinomycetota bacterium]